jgi:heparosan-N-sulfate-glucuronate 5-epimerase
MSKANIEINMPVGNVSYDSNLGTYYQDFTEALIHYNDNYFGEFDSNGIPMVGFGKDAHYSQIYIIQLGLISHDLILKKVKQNENLQVLERCVNWLIDNEEYFNESIIWRNNYSNERYGLSAGWVSSMYQGQIISLFLRYGQMTNQLDYFIEKSLKIYSYFDYHYNDGGVQRRDENNNLWFEEYPSPEPSFVLNGFIYTLFGIVDLYRVTNDIRIQKVIDECVETLENNMEKYSLNYWSIYDQLHKELASKYYHKNIHIPLMEIMFKLTKKKIFNEYKIKWEKQLYSPFNYILVQIMYRLRPRILKLQKLKQ